MPNGRLELAREEVRMVFLIPATEATCVLPPVQCQRSTPVFKKRHVSSSALEAEERVLSWQRMLQQQRAKGALIPFPKQKSTSPTLSPLLTIVPRLSPGFVLFPLFAAGCFPVN